MPPDDNIKNKAVQTFASDMAGVIDGDKAGLLKKIIHEEEDKEIENKNLSPESRKNKAFLVVSIILTCVAAGVLLFFLLKKNIYTVDVPPQFVPIIFTDQTDFLEVYGLSKDEVAQAILNKIATTEVKQGGVDGVYLTEKKKIVGFKEFINLLKGNLIFGPTTQIQDQFLMGAVNEKNKDFFILLKLGSFADAFTEMRVWERKMFSDLYALFAVSINVETKELYTKDFEDVFIQNKNARVLYDKDGNIVMMYVFIDDNTLLITNTEDATREVILRLASSKVKK